MISRAVLVAALLLAGADDTIVKVIPLQHRTADDIVPLVLPLAGPDGTVSGLGTRLVVRARPAALAQIEESLKALDTPARMLWITVRQGLARSGSSRSAEASGSVTIRGGIVETRTSRTVVTGSLGRQSTSDSGTDVQRLQVLEGGRAFIRTGEAVPQPGVVVSGNPPVIVAGTTYTEASVGFYVVPRVAGDQVTLEIETAGDRPNDRGGIDVQRLQTTVSGRLGDWIELGAVVRDRASRTSEPLGVAQQQSVEERSVQVKVEEVR